jgi:hypothetical protein
MKYRKRGLHRSGEHPPAVALAYPPGRKTRVGSDKRVAAELSLHLLAAVTDVLHGSLRSRIRLRKRPHTFGCLRRVPYPPLLIFWPCCLLATLAVPLKALGGN